MLRTSFFFVALLASAAWAGDDVGRLFAARCASCHTVPDPSLAADRAWLDQIRRTT